ncbi:helix-turn-helix domain-containing protein [Neorhizobium tomejilense]|uniref:helix-turn-helix domain-containing protein n=1 Tax=Neorhizobium tomejilense TaxID=2093828 RepID=UPI001FDF0D50|nr:helix-turn-helix transcriptional regulator [Neorhizobium tomejilense]
MTVPGIQLLELRTAEGAGIRDVGKRLGTSPATLSRIERARDFDISMARAVSKNSGLCLCCGQDWPSPFRSIIHTQDGTCIIVDPDVGAVSAPNREAAEAEIRRRKGRAS